MMSGRFSAMVGALIRDARSGRYLVLRRSEEKDIGAGEWECVTGRVEQGESFLQALEREVMEELGVQVHADFIVKTEHFYRGVPKPENEMLGVMYCCSLSEPGAIQTSWEHTAAQWVTPDESVQLLPDGHWLLDLIQQAEIMRTLMPVELLMYYRQAGI